MGEGFSASEIAQIGIKIEENGRDFYIALAKSSKSASTREVFLYLAKEEERHIKVFNDILAGFEDYQPPGAYPMEYFDYLSALSKLYVFTEEKKGVMIAKKVRDDIEAIETGIGFEKDSILFYHEIRDLVWEEGRVIIDKLINEERGHLKKLLDIKEKLFKGVL